MVALKFDTHQYYCAPVQAFLLAATAFTVASVLTADAQELLLALPVGLEL